MKWSQKLPSVDGLYWFAFYPPSRDIPKIVEVKTSGGKVTMKSQIGDWVDVTDWNRWWAGPILPPDNP